jgi:predicted AAA+ superfamily ATPase
MPNLLYAAWPFKPAEQRSDSQAARWWEECFVSIPGFDDFLDEPDWHVIVGAVGTGKSTALAMITQERAKIFNRNLSR